MDRTIVFDKRTQFNHLKGCEILFESLRQEHDVQFDDEDSFKEILKYRPDFIKFLDLEKSWEESKVGYRTFEKHRPPLSSFKEGHDGLEEKLKRALRLREWLEPRKKVANWFKYIQEDMQKFKTEVLELKCLMSSGMIMTIQQSKVCILLEICDENLEKLLNSYRVKLIDNGNYISFIQDLYAVQEKEDPTSGVPMSAAVSRSRENVMVDLEKLWNSLEKVT